MNYPFSYLFFQALLPNKYLASDIDDAMFERSKSNNCERVEAEMKWWLKEPWANNVEQGDGGPQEPVRMFGEGLLPLPVTYVRV